MYVLPNIGNKQYLPNEGSVQKITYIAVEHQNLKFL